jgi:hypothetical protein
MTTQWITRVFIAIFLFAPVLTMVYSPDKFVDKIEISGETDDDTTESIEFDELIKFVKHLKALQLSQLNASSLTFPEFHFSVLQVHLLDVPTPPPDSNLIG